ncbi:hypothetical protein H0H93_008591 [Arthromyces matolae]|nr:hypothetical protein H0H93_008591 [Arthromyces matolae]
MKKVLMNFKAVFITCGTQCQLRSLSPDFLAYDHLLYRPELYPAPVRKEALEWVMLQIDIRETHQLIRALDKYFDYEDFRVFLFQLIDLDTESQQKASINTLKEEEANSLLFDKCSTKSLLADHLVRIFKFGQDPDYLDSFAGCPPHERQSLWKMLAYLRFEEFPYLEERLKARLIKIDEILKQNPVKADLKSEQHSIILDLRYIERATCRGGLEHLIENIHIWAYSRLFLIFARGSACWESLISTLGEVALGDQYRVMSRILYVTLPELNLSPGLLDHELVEAFHNAMKTEFIFHDEMVVYDLFFRLRATLMLDEHFLSIIMLCLTPPTPPSSSDELLQTLARTPSLASPAMAQTMHSTENEAAFMADLLGNLDDSFWNAVPTPDTSPAKSITSKLITPRRTPAQSRKPLAPSPSKVFSAGEVNMATLMEGVEDWDWDDTASDFSPKKSPVKKKFNVPPAPTYIPQTCTRCIVESISTESSDFYQKELIVKLDPSQERRRVILRDDWVSTDARIGDTINVLGTFTLASTSSSSITLSITVTAKANLLILHPDLLLTATAISNAPQCRRKPLLSNLVRSTSDTTPALVWGNMLHEVMQSCLSENQWETAWVDQKIDEVVLKGLNELVKINVTIDQAKREVTARAKGLVAFSEKYISDYPKPGAILSNTRTTSKQGESLLAVSELLDIEEDIWSPTYGLKGKLDATVNAIIADPNPPFSTPVVTGGPSPLEIKTGRAVAGMEHRAQTMLYTLLATERYGVDVASGLLYYTQSEEVTKVPASRNEIRGLIIARNEMAAYMMRRNEGVPAESGSTEPFLPPSIDDERVCKRCYALDTCMLYRKAVEGVEDVSSPIADIYELRTSHLSPSRAQFFKHWEALISLEEQDLIRFRKELWTMGAAERELKGRCFSAMVLDASFEAASSLTGDTAGNSKVHRFTYRFNRSPTASSSLLNGHMNVGDPITVSVGPALLAFARGFIVQLTPTEVVVGVDHKLSIGDITKRLSTTSQRGQPIIFRIDKDEFSGAMGRIRDNLAQLFYANGDTRHLELVVDLKSPTFEERPPQLTSEILSHSAHLNVNQTQAMTKVLSAHDYALILGMPGTGKTTVIAAMIKTLVALGKTVLLTSYTHSAVDTILTKLLDADFGILRLGNIDKLSGAGVQSEMTSKIQVHPDVHKFTLANRRQPTTIEQLELQLMSPPVVATTLSHHSGLFTRRKFDYCIVDEASQITLPTCIGPLRYADIFVLVGDHFQLPPLVRNPAARKGGLDVSLFRRLSDAHPHAVVDLTYQYRMNADIMLLSNKLIYGDRLRCGSTAVAQQSLVLPNRDSLRSLHTKSSSPCSEGCWMETLLAESSKAVFVDTDDLPAHDSRVGDLIENKVEAELVRQICETLIQSGIRDEQIGIITLYRQQVKLLAHQLLPYKNIEILTADRSQGRDKDCIIISMVRSNDTGTSEFKAHFFQLGDLVKDWRRMNVSFTRARSKLIIIGSRKTLQETALLSEFFDLMDTRGWILRLPPNAHLLHATTVTQDSNPTTPRHKRLAQDSDENAGLAPPSKKLRTPPKVEFQSGILKGRAILRDLINGEA